MKKFPYYIVRFKLFSVAYFVLGLCCFHTTQYDLNYCVFSEKMKHFISFHTTQYDLNHIGGKTSKQRDTFPYYIVRFKPPKSVVRYLVSMGFHTTQYDLNRWFLRGFRILRCAFPYYIVRFKHEVVFLCCPQIGRFPYYIVRFKPDYLLFFSILHTSFHTTQYDLNELL